MKRTFNRFLLTLLGGTLVAVLLLMPIQLCLPTYAAADEVEFWAVIVGVSQYKHYDELSYADDNAQELADQLSSVWGEDHVNLLTNSSATKLGIQNAITDWLDPKVDDNDVVLFYFSGYGERTSSSFAPYNAYYASTWVKSSELNSWLSALDAEKMVVILEFGHSGRFETSLSDSGRVILMSSSSDENSWMDDTLQHSVFTYYILEAISDFDAADTNNDMELSAEEIFNYAQSETEYWEEDQHPQMSDQCSGELGLLVQFIFSPEPNLPSGAEALILDNAHLSTPIALIWTPETVHDLTLISPVDTGSGTRYVFISWDDGNTSTSRTISGGGVYTVNYQKQYELVIESAFGEPEGQGWYDEGSNAAISVTSVEGQTTRHIFTGWSGDYSGSEATASVTMDSPKTITANWRTDFTQLYIFVGVVLVAGGGTLAVLMMRRRKKAAAPAMVESLTQPPQPPPPVQPSQSPTVKYCRHCGAAIQPGDAFCTECGKAVNN